MSLNKQYTYSRNQLLPFFQEVLGKRLERSSLESDASVTEWEVEGYLDGPLTFVAAKHPSGVTFTGWAKFNANDPQYNESSGLYRAFQKAVDKYQKELSYHNTWGVSRLEQDQSITKVIKESVKDEICSNQSSGINSR